MEPFESEVMHTLVSEIVDCKAVHTEHRDSYSFVVAYLQTKFWCVGHCPFTVGDRVRITITKEPNNEHA